MSWSAFLSEALSCHSSKDREPHPRAEVLASKGTIRPAPVDLGPESISAFTSFDFHGKRDAAEAAACRQGLFVPMQRGVNSSFLIDAHETRACKEPRARRSSFSLEIPESSALEGARDNLADERFVNSRTLTAALKAKQGLDTHVSVEATVEHSCDERFASRSMLSDALKAMESTRSVKQSHVQEPPISYGRKVACPLASSPSMSVVRQAPRSALVRVVSSRSACSLPTYRSHHSFARLPVAMSFVECR